LNPEKAEIASPPTGPNIGAGWQLLQGFLESSGNHNFWGIWIA
jgi:hypothetical protein